MLEPGADHVYLLYAGAFDADEVRDAARALREAAVSVGRVIVDLRSAALSEPELLEAIVELGQRSQPAIEALVVIGPMGTARALLQDLARRVKWTLAVAATRAEAEEILASTR